MSKGKKWAIVFMALNVILTAVCVIFFCRQDRKPPEISFGENEWVWSKSTDQKRLLEGVFAMDQQDGDLSGRIVIEKILPDEEKEQVVVFYAVTDHAGNAAKASRVFSAVFPDEEEMPGTAGYVDDLEGAGIGYQDSASWPSDPEIPPGSSALPSMTTFASPDVQVPDVQGTEPSASPGVSPVPAQTPQRTPEPVQESMPEQVLEPASEQVQGNDRQGESEEGEEEPTGEQPPVLELNTSEVIVKAGEGPAWVSIIQTLSDDKDSYETLFRNLSVSKYDKNAPGNYSVTVTTRDSNDNTSAPRNLTIHVKQV